MKKVLVKILTLVLAFTSLFAISLFVGCDCSDGPGGTNVIPKPEEQIEKVLKLDSSDLNVVVGDEVQLTASYKKEEGKTLAYTSSDPNVVTVDNLGKIVANNKGTAKIIATYGDLTAECNVSVTFGNYLPELVFDGGVLDVYNLGLDGSTFEFVPMVKFNGKLFSDVEATYVSANEEIAKFDNAEAIAVALGQTTATVTASWRGFTVDNVPALQKTITIKTNNVVNFLINNQPCDTIEMSTFEGVFEGETYSTSANFLAKIVFNGEQLKSIPVIEVEDKNVVSFSNNKLTSVSGGQTKINLTYNANDGSSYSTAINVIVTRPVADSGKEFSYFSAELGYYKDIYNNFANTSIVKEVLGADAANASDAYVLDTNVQLTVDGDKVLNAPVEKDKFKTNTIVIATPTYGYSCVIETYSAVIADKEDLALLDVHYLDAEKTAMSYIDGYCEVVRDIDATGFKTSHTAVQPSNPTHALNGAKTEGTLMKDVTFKAGFSGTFNGNGHTIFNLDTTRDVVYNNNKGKDETNKTGVGLFGFLQGTYVIKNIAFENMKVDKGNGLSYTAYSYVSDNEISKKGNGTFENLYISLSEDSRAPQGLLFATCYGGRYTLNSVVINAPNLTYDPNYAGQYKASGLIDANGSAIEKGDRKVLNGVIIISKHPIATFNYYTTYGVNEDVYVDGKLVKDIVIDLNKGYGDYDKKADELKDPDGKIDTAYKYSDLTTEEKNKLFGAYPYHRKISGIYKYESAKEMATSVGSGVSLSMFSSTYWQIEENDGGKVLRWKSLMGYSFDLYDENDEIFDSVLFDREGASMAFSIRNSLEEITEYKVGVSDPEVLEVRDGVIRLKEYRVGDYEVIVQFVNSFGTTIRRVIPVRVDALNVPSYLQEDGEVVMHGLSELPAGAEFSINGIATPHTFENGKIKLDLSNVDLSEVRYTDIVDVYVKTDSGKDIRFKASYVTLAIDEKEDLTFFNVGYTYDQAEFDAITDEAEKIAYLENAQKNPYDYYDGYYVLTQNIDAEGVTLNHEAVFAVTEANAKLIGWTYDEATDEFTDNNNSAISYGGKDYIIPRDGYPVTTMTSHESKYYAPAAFRYKIGLRGTFDGQGYVIDNLKTWRQNPTFVGNDSSTVKPTPFGAGLFGVVNGGALIKNVALTNVNMSGKISGASQYGTTFALVDISVGAVLTEPPTYSYYAGPNDAFTVQENMVYQNVYVHSNATQVYGTLFIFSADAKGTKFENVIINLPQLTSAAYNNSTTLNALIGGTASWTRKATGGGSGMKHLASNVYIAYNNYTLKGTSFTADLDVTIAPTMADLYSATVNMQNEAKTMVESFANNEYFEIISRGNAQGVIFKGVDFDRALTVLDADGNEIDEIEFNPNNQSQVINVKDALGVIPFDDVTVDFGTNAGNLVYDDTTGEIKVDGDYIANDGGYEVTFESTIYEGDNPITVAKTIKVICNPTAINAYLSYDDAEIVAHGLEATEILSVEEYKYMIGEVDVTGSINGTKILLDSENLQTATLPSEMPGSVTVKVVNRANGSIEVVFNTTYVSLAIDEAEDLTKFNVGYTFDQDEFDAITDEAEKDAYLAACAANPYDYYDGYYVLTQDIDADGIEFVHEAVFAVEGASAALIGWTYDEATDTFTDNNNSAISYGGVDYIIPRDGYPVVTLLGDKKQYGPAAFCYKIGFRGTFDGQGYVIDNLKGWRQNPTFVGNDSSTVSPVTFGAGLFGVTNSGSVIKNVALTNVVVAGKIGNASQYGTTFALIDIAVAGISTSTPGNTYNAGPDDAFTTKAKTLYENVYLHSEVVQAYGMFYLYSADATGSQLNNVVINLPSLTKAAYHSGFNALVGGDVVYTQTNTGLKNDVKNLYVVYNTYTSWLPLETQTILNKGKENEKTVQLDFFDITYAPTMAELYSATTNYYGTAKTMAESFANNPYWTVNGNEVTWAGLATQA